MRYLIDTNIFVYLALDAERLSRDVIALIQEPDALLCISAESVRELVVGYRTKGLGSKRWKTAEEMVRAVEEEFYIRILPLKRSTCGHCRDWKSMRHKTIKILQTM